MDNFHPHPVEQNGSDCRQAIRSVSLARPNGPAYSTGELLNTPTVIEIEMDCGGLTEMRSRVCVCAWLPDGPRVLTGALSVRRRSAPRVECL